MQMEHADGFEAAMEAQRQRARRQRVSVRTLTVQRAIEADRRRSGRHEFPRASMRALEASSQ